jgi:hypothetical protein
MFFYSCAGPLTRTGFLKYDHESKKIGLGIESKFIFESDNFILGYPTDPELKNSSSLDTAEPASIQISSNNAT